MKERNWIRSRRRYLGRWIRLNSVKHQFYLWKAKTSRNLITQQQNILSCKIGSSWAFVRLLLLALSGTDKITFSKRVFLCIYQDSTSAISSHLEDERILDGFLHVPLEEDVFSFALRGTSLVNSLAETLLLFIFLVCIENGLRLCSHRRRV